MSRVEVALVVCIVLAMLPFFAQMAGCPIVTP